MLKILKYLKRKEWMMILFSVIFIVVQVYLDLELPEYMSKITQLIQIPGSKMQDIFENGGYMMLCALGSLVASFVTVFFVSKVAAGLSRTIRSEVFTKVEGFSMEEINHFSTSSLITRSSNDVTQIQMAMSLGLQVLIKAPIMAIWAISKIVDKSWEWTLSTAGAVGVLFLIISVVVIFALPKFKVIQTLTDNLNRVTRENLTGLRVIRAYNAENFEEEKFETANHKLMNTNLFINRIMAIMGPGMTLIMSGLSLSIYWIGAYLINDVQLTSQASVLDRVDIFSDMVVFSSYAIQVVISFMMLTIVFIIVPRAAVSAGRILEVLNTKETIKDGTLTQSTQDQKGTVVFDNVSFQYPDASEAILENISFTANKGETVAFIGSTGSGKSTLVNLIPRFFDVTGGQIKVNGQDIKEYTQKYLHSLVGFVPQKAFLFSGTVRSNVSYGDAGHEVTEADMKKAIEIAQSSDFVEKMEDGYDASISQSGSNVSGGQRQRLAISRAISRKPEILVFDDSFSALDYKTDRVLRAALNKELKDTTKLIVAQRIGTIRDADKIIVLDEGKIVGIGTHQELMQTCEVYQDIAYSQLSKEELADE
ncbi:ABC transporter ATP-binding protein/permease [Carnobacterium viridans]|uniref:ATP-binding cassette, subfamily B n=1 Tax=Carnobacterium viridans TaxID=174587 RepID=A0A1H1BL97_9LACT|nr:ABC transporter ATP-binding protein [Carnobacterium viridans]UDE95739.1 ABC transporter ATP-binding protein/permease [Carnobacterium viridans]SDQ52722.1 ATP-binding cassette, subfamily B [Carnobacterium viridans]